jgi:hypothetical protein
VRRCGARPFPNNTENLRNTGVYKRYYPISDDMPLVPVATCAKEDLRDRGVRKQDAPVQVFLSGVLL